MWQIYDQLIEQLSGNYRVLEIIQTKRRIFVKSEAGFGTAMTFDETAFETEKYLGQTIKELAPFIKSWDFSLASLALAAMNSVFNNQESLDELGKSGYSIDHHDIFAEYSNPGACQIATVGYFRYLNRYPKLAQSVKVLELKAIPGTYPASASEFILPEMDVVFITGSTLVNKTLPRLLTLSKNATTILVGGTVPLSTVLFDSQVDIVSTKFIETWPPTLNDSKMKGTSINLKQKGDLL